MQIADLAATVERLRGALLHIRERTDQETPDVEMWIEVVEIIDAALSGQRAG